MWIGQRKDIRKLTFRALALRRSESIKIDLFSLQSVHDRNSVSERPRWVVAYV